jgi:hypothetical protein
MTVSTTELAMAQKFLDAFKAYGLNPAEAGAAVSMVTSTPYGARAEELGSDGLSIEVGAKPVQDLERRKVVYATVNTFIEDFLNAIEIDRKQMNLMAKGGGVRTGTGGFSNPYLRIENYEQCKTREGCRRSVDDIWHGLDKMIAHKRLGIAV